MKTKIFIDFDGTVFDTLRFKKRMYQVFESIGFSEDEITGAYNAECLDFKYSPVDNLKRLQQIRKFDFGKAIEKLNKIYKYVPEYIYKDTIDFLKQLDIDLYEVNLLSLGDIDFQRRKVMHSGIEKYFDNIYYCDIQKWEYLDKLVDLNEKFIIIDDRGDTMERISKKFRRSMAIKISRFDKLCDEYMPVDNFNGIEVKSLNQAAQYL